MMAINSIPLISLFPRQQTPPDRQQFDINMPNVCLIHVYLKVFAFWDMEGIMSESNTW